MRDSIPDTAITPCGIDHLVLYVRDLEESHVFWTEYLGFRHVGTLRRGLSEHDKDTTRFYSGEQDGQLSHHHIALVEEPDKVATKAHSGIDHIAVSYASEDAWNRQLRYLETKGIVPGRKVVRGTIGSTFVSDPNGYAIELVYQLPRETWSSDINAALNKTPTEI